MAEYHFRRALAINNVSSVLRCYLSMALHSQNDDNKSFEALDVLIQACKVDPKNPQVCQILNDYVIYYAKIYYNWNKEQCCLECHNINALIIVIFFAVAFLSHYKWHLMRSLCIFILFSQHYALRHTVHSS